VWRPQAVRSPSLHEQKRRPLLGLQLLGKKAISTGCTSTVEFCPDDPVNRAQAVTFLYRFLSNGPNPTHWSEPFTDVGPSRYFYDAVVWTYNMGITSGVGSNLFAPYQNLSRADSAVFLHRAEGLPASQSGWSEPFNDVRRVTISTRPSSGGTTGGFLLGLRQRSSALALT